MRISDWSSDVCSSDLPPPPSATLKPTDAFVPGCAPPASVSFAASIDSTQCSPPCRAVLVDRVNAAPEAGCDSATPPDTSQASAKAPAAASTTSLNTTSRSPAAGKPVAPSAGVVDTRRSEEHTSELQSLMRLSYAFFLLKK